MGESSQQQRPARQLVREGQSLDPAGAGNGNPDSPVSGVERLDAVREATDQVRESLLGQPTWRPWAGTTDQAGESLLGQPMWRPWAGTTDQSLLGQPMWGPWLGTTDQARESLWEQ